ncbi:DNA repair protein UVH3-like isoform X2 [Musa acuminata AAA Group]|uniref:DNA repair protein UVH3-like isoform X2 n=1 Tax=Musa acuminata AAA Group TaxID=214697 RepID=UPI0031DC12A0
MGVQGLWELLAPVGRRVSVETLAGKKLAIDASIWMVQFMKAMRDDKGEMVRNAHLLGFFRRICKLLFLRTKPVFVFDGATPALKRRTVAARRRHRDSARAKIRKTAEKLLLNHLKAKRLEELAAEIKKQKEGSKEKQISDEDTKGKKVLDSNDEIGAEGSSVLLRGDMESGVSSQKNLDELLAASLAAEEEMEINKNVLTSEGGLDEAEDDNDENEELIFPMDNIHIDPAVLASLPPSMQLDLLVQMRESIMAENRQKYQKIKKAPTKFSELQIQSYLKTIAFRREIDEVQKCAAGRGIAGVQTSRIASEANREFIFSSSFTGDKQVLASRGVANSGNGDHYSVAKESTSDSAKCSLLSNQPKLVKEVSVSKHVKDFGPDVETYCDENGRVRVSRVKGLGICMTRDLQRNLDLMEKYEQEKRRGDNSLDQEASHTKKVVDVSEGLSGNNHSPIVTNNEGKGETFSEKSSSLPLDRRGYMDEFTIHGSENAIEISFSEDDSGMKATDVDNIFMQLVSGGQTANLPLECVHSDKSTNDSESDCSWEEGLVKEISEIPNGFADITASPKSDLKKNQSSLAESSYEVADVDWEEGVCQNPDTSSQFLDKPVKDVSRGTLEEEADIQEAIRRSLEDFKEQNSSTNSSAVTELVRSVKDQISDGVVLHKLVTNACVHLDNDAEESPSCNDGQLDNRCKEDDLQIPDSSKNNLDSNNLSGLDFDGESSLISSREDEQIVMTSQRGNIPPGKPSDDHPSWLEQSLDASYEVQIKSCSRMSTEELCEIRPDTSTNITDDGSKVVGSSNHDSRHISRSSVSPERGYNNSLSGNSSLMEEIIDTGMKSQQNIAEKDNVVSDHIGYSTQILNNQMEVSEASLDKEISLLRQERVNLGNEQRMLERDAESVNNEMFAECQELLQMFGLPYIIAPTEAEAQCAYMEMTNLVDGVVTDDSDVFLFGARSVYKNIFDDRKYVETYFVKDIECELGLDRDKLIRMALLLGSDYTEGVSGIGIVNAIEVIHAFPEEDGLQKFRQWVESPDPAILGKLVTGSHSNRSLKENNNGADAIKRSSQGDASEESVSRGHDDEKPTGNEAIKDIFIDKHRNVSKNWHISPSFPSEMVISAYTSPQVDESTEPFMWGKPDLPLLRKLCWEKFGWTTQKADELLVPVLKEYNKHETQLRLEAFYTFNERFAKVRSQRIKKALKGITGTLSSDLTDELVKEGPSSRKKRCTGLSTGEEYKPENSTGGNSKRGKKVMRQSRGQKTEKEFIYSEDLAGDSLVLEKDDIDDTSVLSLNRTVKGRRGRGRGRGRGARGRGKGKGRGRSSPIKADSDSTDDGDDYNANVQLENHSKVPEVLPKLRRSMRPLKQVQYAEEDFEVDESNGTLNPSGSKLLGVATEQEPIENDSRSRVGDLSDVDKGAHTFSKDSSSGDYLFSGGGFCLDDNDLQGDAIQLAASPIQGSAEMDCEDTDGCKQRALEDDTSRGYLFSGGGFCMDESDEQVDATRPTSSQIENSRPSRDGQSNLGLSAMSSLRRKRRKT